MGFSEYPHPFNECTRAANFCSTTTTTQRVAIQAAAIQPVIFRSKR